MEIAEHSTYTAQQRDQLADGDADASGIHHLGLSWRDKTGHVVAREGHQLIAHAEWVEVDLRASKQAFHAVGLGGVLVHRRARGSGVGKTIVRAAMRLMNRTGRPIELLFYVKALVSFYETLGWAPITNPKWITPAAKVHMPLRSCWIPLRDNATLPTQWLSLDGLPF